MIKIKLNMKREGSRFVFKFASLMLVSSVVLFGDYLSKCIPDPGTLMNGSCSWHFSTCNECADGWWKCFDDGGVCVITRMQGITTRFGCVTVRTSTTTALMKCSF